MIFINRHRNVGLNVGLKMSEGSQNVNKSVFDIPNILSRNEPDDKINDKINDKIKRQEVEPFL